jgi:hypothetical protein
MNSNAVPLRAVRLVRDMGENAFVWIVDARDSDSIVCAVLRFDSTEEAASTEKRIASHIGSDCSIDDLVELAEAHESPYEREAFGDPEEIIDYLGGEADQALQWNARKMLAEMGIACA